MADARTTVVMPVFNRARYVGEAVDSVLRQTCGDWRLIVYDDGSTDGSMAVAREAAAGDGRVSFHRSEENRGLTPALVEACGMAGTPYLGTLDSDDRLHPECLAATADVLDRRAEVGMVYTQYERIGPSGERGGVGKRCLRPFDANRLLVDFMCFHFRLMRRDVYEEVGGFDPAYERAQDYDLCLRLSEATSVAHVARPLYEYRVHQESASFTGRFRQIEDSRRAVEAALRRRGGGGGLGARGSGGKQVPPPPTIQTLRAVCDPLGRRVGFSPPSASP